MKFSPGQVIRFTYHQHTGLRPGEPVDDFKEVLVLHPNWAGKTHGIDLKRLSPAEREVLDTIMDPAWRGKTHHLPLVNDILRRMDPVNEIKNPVSFYSKFVKVFLRNKDAYRTYYPNLMLAVTVVQQTHVKGSVYNPKPLFHKPGESSGTPSETPAKQDRLALIKQRAQASKAGGGTERPTVKRPELQRAKKPPRNK